MKNKKIANLTQQLLTEKETKRLYFLFELSVSLITKTVGGPCHSIPLGTFFEPLSPQYVPQFTEEQKDLIAKLRNELRELAAKFGYTGQKEDGGKVFAVRRNYVASTIPFHATVARMFLKFLPDGVDLNDAGDYIDTFLALSPDEVDDDGRTLLGMPDARKHIVAGLIHRAVSRDEALLLKTKQLISFMRDCSGETIAVEPYSMQIYAGGENAAVFCGEKAILKIETRGSDEKYFFFSLPCKNDDSIIDYGNGISLGLEDSMDSLREHFQGHKYIDEVLVALFNIVTCLQE